MKNNPSSPAWEKASTIQCGYRKLRTKASTSGYRKLCTKASTIQCGYRKLCTSARFFPKLSRMGTAKMK